jgi:hypothetical protein
MAQTAAGVLNPDVPSSRMEAMVALNVLPCRSEPDIPSARPAPL